MGEALLDRVGYTTDEAARLVGVSARTLGRWLDGHGQDWPVLRQLPRSVPVHGPKMVTWGEMVECGHLAAFRYGRRMPVKCLRAYVAARRHEWPSSARTPGSRRYPLAARPKDASPPVARFFDLVDSDDAGLAVRFWPAGRGVPVVADPLRLSGTPTVRGTRIPAEMLYEMAEAGEGIGDLAAWYDLADREVEAAVAFGDAYRNGTLGESRT